MMITTMKRSADEDKLIRFFSQSSPLNTEYLQN